MPKRRVALCSATRYTFRMASKKPLNPSLGDFIRTEVLPGGMSVTEAAKKLGVGRPALSNLLNGNAALSSEMALRLETTFGANRQGLLEFQEVQEKDQRRDEERAVPVSAYVPSFLIIRARQIAAWASEVLDARSELPVLLRMLVHSTGRELRQVDFSGYDNAQRKGWDGWVEADAATPWIPAGQSGWEFGTTEKPATKANGDYAARTKSVPASDRAQTTFVFVTPRNWPGKAKWAKEKSALGQWKAVRVFDASDLEQWLETSVSAQVWLAEKLAVPTEGFETREQCWQGWASASEPPMTPEIFAPSIAVHGETLRKWLDAPPERPFVVAADSRDEALAFLCCLFLEDEIPKLNGDLAVIFESPLILKKLLSSQSCFIPIVSTDEAERELATAYRRLHCIVVRPRNAINSEPDIALDLLRDEAFEKALAEMGVEGDRAEQLRRESGFSPTILRRRLSKIEAIRVPEWAKDAETARTLIPMALIGAWHERSDADREILSQLSGSPYGKMEDAIAHLRTFDDPPVWRVDQYRGVAAKIDALFAVGSFITEEHISKFFDLAECVLSEKDPSLELPEDRRWMAGVYGKVRNHSAALRQGICETLVVLAVHGNNMLGAPFGRDMELRVSTLISELLTPLTLEKLLSHEHDLPRYAEAAPAAVLSILEADLRESEPVLLGLLAPAETSVFGRCFRTGLLWALEVLAWKAENLLRVSLVLAQLSRTTINDNWANKPIASLLAIYRCWVPQSAAPLEVRIKVLETLVRKYPGIGWQICIDQLTRGAQTGSFSYRPQWRNDASGAGRGVTHGECREFTRKALDLAIGWHDHDSHTLGDLVARLDCMTDEDQVAVWDLIDNFSETESDDSAKAELRECIRRFAFTRRGRKRDLSEVTRSRARKARAVLAPSDPVVRHGWLFANQWVEESAEELEDEDLDLLKRDERISRQRSAAMREIWSDRGIEGMTTLVQKGNAPWAVGHCTARILPDQAEAEMVIESLLRIPPDPESKVNSCLQGFIFALDPAVRPIILSAIAGVSDVETCARLFSCAPFGDATWRLLDENTPEIRSRYWGEVLPEWNRFSESELNEVIDRLLEVQRPRVAFNAVHLDWERIETSRLQRLLTTLPRSCEPEGTFRLEGYQIAAALKELDGRSGVSRDEMARLEFQYLQALEHTEHGFPNLERQLTDSPDMFALAVSLAYKRSDDGEDAPGWRIDDPELRSTAALSAHHLLEQMRRLPGSEDGVIDADALSRWLTKARRLCTEHARADIGDQRLGHLLAQAPPEPDGNLWPCRAVCEAMEAVASEHLGIGFRVAVINSRGMHHRGEGGDQERELADKYKKLAQGTAFDYPFVSSVLEAIASSYEHDAEREDSRSRVDRRLRG